MSICKVEQLENILCKNTLAKQGTKSHQASHASYAWTTSYEICSYHLLVAISETTKLFLPRGVPAIEADFATVGAKI